MVLPNENPPSLPGPVDPDPGALSVAGFSVALRVGDVQGSRRHRDHDGGGRSLLACDDGAVRGGDAIAGHPVGTPHREQPDQQDAQWGDEHEDQSCADRWVHRLEQSTGHVQKAEMDIRVDSDLRPWDAERGSAACGVETAVYGCETPAPIRSDLD